MTDVKKAEAVVAALEAKRAACVRRGTDLQDERANVALAAHTGDATARAKLDEINTALAVHGSELASLDAALRAAGERLEKARQQEAQKVDRAATQELRKELDRFREHGRQLDASLAAVATNGAALHESLGKIHSLGSAFPTGQQLHSLGARALLTAIALTPWRREFETIAPRERRSFSSLVETWCATIESGLGEQTDEEKAA